MNDAQTWTLIAGFLAVMVAMSSLLLRTVSAEIGGLRSDFNNDLTGQIGTLRSDLTTQIGTLRSDLTTQIGTLRSDLTAEIGTLRSDLTAEIGQVKESLARVETKVDGLDRDVQILFNREFGAGPDSA